MSKRIKLSLYYLILICTVLLALPSCCRSRQQFWDDTQTAGRHMNRGMRSLSGKGSGYSRQVCDRNEFCSVRESPYQQVNFGVAEEEFIPFPDEDLCDQLAMSDYAHPAPRESPGDPGSSIPGIEAFASPSRSADWSRVFKTIYFDYDSNQIRGDNNSAILQGIASYMRSHPNLYLFVEGHCDARGAEAYNLALGARRANSIRNTLIDSGVNPDRLFTISYGKERPASLGNSEEAWSLNRRAEFKIYAR